MINTKAHLLAYPRAYGSLRTAVLELNNRLKHIKANYPDQMNPFLENVLDTLEKAEEAAESHMKELRKVMNEIMKSQEQGTPF